MLLGLHWLDALLLIAYVVAVLVLGRRLARRVKTEKDFFLANRKLGRWFQFFLTFGNMTDPSAAATTASSVYRQGAGGVWLTLIPLPLTPFYWFMCVWFRRVRLTTIGDLFEDRFGRSFLPALYAGMNVGVVILYIGLGNLVAYKTLAPIMVKPESAYTSAEGQSVHDYQEFVQLRKSHTSGALTPALEARYHRLQGYYDRGELLPYVSYLKPAPFYAASSALVAIFVTQGGLEASAIVDAIQAILMLIGSVILLPFGLSRLGGFSGLHHRLAPELFQLFGGAATGEYRWYSIAAFLFVQFIGISSAQANMAISGSAKDELAARLGGVTGGYGKRFVTLAWCLCGLVAIALFGNTLSDPDQAWGLLTRLLLPAGVVGIMIVGILGGKIATLAAQSLVLSALVVKNLYEPYFPGKSARHYMIVARLSVPVVLVLGVVVAVFLGSAVALLKFAIALMVVWGAPILVIFLWRRLTLRAVQIQVILSLLLIGFIPWLVSGTPALRRSAELTRLTRGPNPVSIYFDGGVVPIDPAHPALGSEGQGYFNIEAYLLGRCGLDVAGLTPAQLLSIRYVFDGCFPLLLLFGISLATPRDDPARAARFHAKLKTPIGATAEEDAAAVAASAADPHRYDHTKLFPGSDWEFTKWNRQDAIGFAICGALMFAVIGGFELALHFGG